MNNKKKDPVHRGVDVPALKAKLQASEAGAAALREALTKCASVLAALSDQVASLGYDCLRSIDSAGRGQTTSKGERKMSEHR